MIQFENNIPEKWIIHGYSLLSHINRPAVWPTLTQYSPLLGSPLGPSPAMDPSQQHAPSSKEFCLAALEKALANSKAREQETWKQLNTVLDRFLNLERLILEQKQPPPTPPNIPENITPVWTSPPDDPLCQGTPSTNTSFYKTHWSHWSQHPLHPTSSKRCLSHLDLVCWTHWTHVRALLCNIHIIVITTPIVLHFLSFLLHYLHDSFAIVLRTCVLLTLFISTSTCRVHMFFLHSSYLCLPCFWHEALPYIR